MDVSSLAPLIKTLEILITYLKNIFTNIQAFALQFGKYISPEQPSIGVFIIILFAIMMVKGRFESILTYVLVAVLLALLLGIKLG